ncbi:MAG: hypothetical protein GEU86_08245 [Actinophytocola sp.]|nr:hypothetical protein [Actinophytocola sp.]
MSTTRWLRRPQSKAELRIASIGEVDAPVAEFVGRDLLADPPGTAAETLDLVLVPGASLGGPWRLAGEVIEAFIECERRGVPTLLLAGTAADLETPVAAVCRAVAADDPVVVEHARSRFGADRVHGLPPVAGRRPLLRRRAARRWRDVIVAGTG